MAPRTPITSRAEEFEHLVAALKEALQDVFVNPGGNEDAGRPIQPGEVVSEDRAARALPIRRADAVKWLRSEGLVRTLAGRRVVVWNAVLARLQQQQASGDRRERTQSRSAFQPLAKPGRIFG